MTQDRKKEEGEEKASVMEICADCCRPSSTHRQIPRTAGTRPWWGAADACGIPRQAGAGEDADVGAGAADDDIADLGRIWHQIREDVAGDGVVLVDAELDNLGGRGAR